VEKINTLRRKVEKIKTENISIIIRENISINEGIKMKRKSERATRERKENIKKKENEDTTGRDRVLDHDCMNLMKSI